MNKNLLYVVIGLGIAMVFIIFGEKILIDKIADRVVKKLQKEYSPSPYGPGFNPDLIDMDKVQKK